MIFIVLAVLVVLLIVGYYYWQQQRHKKLEAARAAADPEGLWVVDTERTKSVPFTEDWTRKFIITKHGNHYVLWRFKNNELITLGGPSIESHNTVIDSDRVLEVSHSYDLNTYDFRTNVTSKLGLMGTLPLNFSVSENYLLVLNGDLQHMTFKRGSDSERQSLMSQLKPVAQ